MNLKLFLLPVANCLLFFFIPASVRTGTGGRLLFALLLAGGLIGVETSFAQSSRLWATYFGGSGDEFQSSVATDAAGNVYMAGTTNSTSEIVFTGTGGHQTINNGQSDAFLVKFNATGNLLWSTYYGGTGDDGAKSVATDDAGNVYLAGYTTSPNILNCIATVSGSHQYIFGGGTNDGFLVKFDATGNRLWATYYGGSIDDQAQSVAADVAGNVYLAGYTNSYNGISSSGYQPSFAGSEDAFLVKFDANGNRLWGTYYGGIGDEEPMSIATDASGNIFMTGFTRSSNFPTLNPGGTTYFWAAPTTGINDAFIVKFRADGIRLWATCYGGFGNDIGYSVATDATNNLYLAGSTISSTGIASGGFQNAPGLPGTVDAFLVKFNNAGARQWGTYYGGTRAEAGYSIATDAADDVYLAGHTNSLSGLASNGFQAVSGGGLLGNDNFLVKFNGAGNRLCATYYGGTGDEQSNNCIAIDDAGKVYMAGYTYSASGIASGSLQDTLFDGAKDAYLAKISATLTVTASSYALSCNGDCNGTSTATALGGVSPYTYAWSNGQATQTATGLCAGTHIVIVVDAMGNSDTAAVNISAPPPLNVNATPTNSVVCSCNGSAMAAASGGTPGYSYSWATGATQTTANATGLCGGAYTVTVTDKNSCTATSTVTISQPSVTVTPIASNATVCRGDLTTIGVNGGGSGPYTYFWSPVGSTQNIITISPPIPGTWTYTVFATNGTCTATASIPVTVVPTPSPTITPALVSVCLGKDVTLTAYPGAGVSGETYLWSTGATTFTTTVTPTAITTYTVSVSVNGMCTRSKTTTITVTYLPVTLTATPSVLCSGERTTLTASPASGGTYLWNTSPPQTTSTHTISIPPPLGATNYAVIFTDTNSGCKGIGTASVMVNPAPTVSIASAFGLVTICAGNSATLTASQTGGAAPFTYSWSPGSLPSNSLIAVTPPIGTTNYSVVVTDLNGCKGTNSIPLTGTTAQYPPPTVPPTMYCYGDTIKPLKINNHVPPAGIIWIDASLVWHFDPYTPPITAVGIYPYAVVQGYPGCFAGPTVFTLTVNPLPVVDAGSDIAICPGDPAELNVTDAAANPPYTYSWSPSNLVDDPVKQKPSATPHDSITTFHVWVTDGRGCKAYDSVSVQLSYSENCSTICDSVYNGITPNGDGINDTWVIKGIETSHDSNTVAIFNRWGNQVWIKQKYDNRAGWDGTNTDKQKLPDGTYFYVIEMYHKKILIICKGWIEVTH